MDSTSDALCIQFLGGGYLTRSGIAIADMDTARLQSFLCYLLLYAQKPQPRQQIASILWSSSTESQARTNLRKCLHRLRHTLHDVDQFILMDGNTIQWRADATAVVDIHEFERCLVESLRYKQAGQVDKFAAALKQAIALYQGDLLPTCYDDWIAVPRDRLANQYLLALNELVALLENKHDYLEAIYYAHKLLEHNPLQEASYQRLITLYSLAGHHARAIELYYQCADMLKQEMNLEPSTETRALFERVKTSSSSPAEKQPVWRVEQLTVVFTDIAGFSKLSQTHNSTVLFERLNQYMNLLNQIIQDGNGRVVKRLGDAVLAVFTQPTDALRAAYKIQKRLRDFNQTDLLPFHTRIGIATGEVSVLSMNIEGNHEWEVVGNRVNTASRLEKLSPINGIAFDTHTYTSCESTLFGKVSNSVLIADGVEEHVYIVNSKDINQTLPPM